MESELEVAAVDCRRVEHLVHKSRELFRTGEHDRGQLALVAGRRGRRQQARRADDGVQLVAELVPEVDEQLGVEPRVAGRCAVGFDLFHWAFRRSLLLEALGSVRTARPTARCYQTGSAA